MTLHSLQNDIEMKLTKFSDDIIIKMKNFENSIFLHLKSTSSRYKNFKNSKMLLSQ